MSWLGRFFGPRKPPSPKEYPQSLRKAAKRGNLEEVRELIDRGADVDAADRANRTALMLAAWNKQLEVVRYLLEHAANPNLQDSNGKTALMLSMSGAASTLEFGYGIGGRQRQIASALLDTGRLDVNLRDENGTTALMIAAWYGAYVEKPTVGLSESAIVPHITDLIRQGADVNARLTRSVSPKVFSGGIQPVLVPKRSRLGDFERSFAGSAGGTALMMAAAQGHLETVRLLLRAGADVSIKTEGPYGRTALVIADRMCETLKANRLDSSWAEFIQIAEAVSGTLRFPPANTESKERFLVDSKQTDDKVPCAKCGSLILRRTARLSNGLCMACRGVRSVFG